MRGEEMVIDEIREMLFAKQDTAYRDFQAKLIPTMDKETVIGVRTPELRKWRSSWQRGKISARF